MVTNNLLNLNDKTLTRASRLLFAALFSLARYFLPYVVVAVTCNSDRIFIGRSGLLTSIITGATTTPATYFNNVQTNATFPNSSYIWYGPGTNAGCPTSIRARQSFQIKCLQEKAMIRIITSGSYNYTLQLTTTQTENATSAFNEDKYEYDPNNTGAFTCGISFLSIEAKSSL